jgi:inorganic pyrophosphatase
MSINNVTAGKLVPHEFNVIIEIPMAADPVKYEVDKASGALFVDRFMMTAMHYPANYGYVPQTVADDDDPVDVLVHTPFPLLSGVVVRCRAVGILRMDDESGGDAKLLAVPAEEGKWVKIIGWAGVDVAHTEILNGIKRYDAEHRTRGNPT